MVLNAKATALVFPSLLFGIVGSCVSSLHFSSGFYFDIFNICSGLFGAVLFFIFMYLLLRYREQNAASLSEQIASKRQVICRGMASFHKSAINKIAGCLFLSDAAVEFYQTKGNICGRNIAIPLYDIVSITTKGTVMTIKTTEQNYSFSVCQIKEWEKQVNNIISQC